MKKRVEREDRKKEWSKEERKGGRMIGRKGGGGSRSRDWLCDSPKSRKLGWILSKLPG